ncbi:MAG: 2-oxo acid dehydrogenase subunit E2 [Chloroflexi bacterium]|nr:MAG: 2-oxo acid dehydrogenase subunit E2 [Chloroflexota bacterium]
MMAVVTMPQLGESITEGTIARWLKKVGDPVKKYESLVEVITDKVNAEVPAPVAGVLKEIRVQEGATVTVGTEICVIEESVPATVSSAAPKQSAPSREEQPAHTATAPTRNGGEEAHGRLSPAVRTLADEHGIGDDELGKVQGTGVGGRISKRDLQDYIERRGAGAGKAPAVQAPTAAPRAGDEVIPLSPIRRSIATHMVKSKQTTPHAWTVAEVDMTNVVRFRRSVKESFKQREGVDLTYLPIVIKGVVEQLKDNPRLNASWGEDKILVHHDFNIGIAVSIDDGLVVPVIHQADKLSIAALARATDDLARRARAQKLTLQDVQGGTFTVNNPGTFGNILSYAIINSPEAAILSMEAIVKRPVVLDGDAIAVRSMMNLCLSFDHRVMDGANAARFLQGLRRWLEGVSEQLPLY